MDWSELDSLIGSSDDVVAITAGKMKQYKQEYDNNQISSDELTQLTSDLVKFNNITDSAQALETQVARHDAFELMVKLISMIPIK